MPSVTQSPVRRADTGTVELMAQGKAKIKDTDDALIRAQKVGSFLLPWHLYRGFHMRALSLKVCELHANQQAGRCISCASSSIKFFMMVCSSSGSQI